LGLAGADWATLKLSLKPSAMFAMVFAQNFMVFQVPVILLQRLVGAELVVIFTVSRTILATARQLLQTVTNAIAPEITLSYGAGEMKTLLTLFHNSEKLVFFLIPVANLGAFLFAPLVLKAWLHDGRFFYPGLCGMMALISGAMSMREHKQFFQFSTNVHKQLSLIVFGGNVLMIGLSIPATLTFGVYGFLTVWLLSELSQMALLYRENKLLFSNDDSITIGPVLRLVALMVIALPCCYALIALGQSRSASAMAAFASAGILLIALPSYFLFGMNDLRAYLPQRLGRTA
jgi:O-antigen/teichoic acid export membrane protein